MLELDQKLVIEVESLQSISPVVHVQISFAVRVQFREKLMKKWLSQVESSQGLFTFDEALEVSETNLALIICSSLEAVLK